MKERKELKTVTLVAAILFATLAFNQFYSGINLYRGKEAQWKHRMDSSLEIHLYGQIGERHLAASAENETHFDPERQELVVRQPASGQEFRFPLDPGGHFKNNHLRCFADLPPGFRPDFARLDSLVREALGREGRHARIRYTLRDSLARPLLSFPAKEKTRPGGTPLATRLPLGPRSQEYVEVRYNYPFRHFLGEAQAETASLVTLLLLLAGCALFITRSYRRQLRHAEEQEEMMMHVMHEVNRPLLNIDMYADLLREDSIAPDDQEGQENAAAIKENIAQLKDSSQHLLRRLTALQELRVRKEVFNFRDELEKLLRSFNHNSKVRFTLDYRLSLSIINASQVHLLNAIANLLDNAGKYSYDGDEVIVRCLSEGDSVRVEIEDHGPGIPPEKQAAIFRKYYRNEALRKVGKAQGFGLGLPYVRQVVGKHRGRLLLESVPGKGCTFIIVLPKNFIYGK